MSDSTTEHPQSTGAALPPAELAWRSWPVVDEGGKRWPVLALAVIALGVVNWVRESHVWGLAAAGLILIAAWRLFIPVRYELTSSGITQHFLGRRRRIPWRTIRRYEMEGDGIFLAANEQPGALDAFRGLYLPWGRHREDVIQFLRYYVGPPTA